MEEDSQPSLSKAQKLFDLNDLPKAKEVIEALLDSGQCPSGTYFLKAQIFSRMGSPLEALQAVEAELLVSPASPGALEYFKALDQRLSTPGSDVPSERPWATSLDSKGIGHFEHCSHRYTYRSIPMAKNAFDFALYPLLLWELKPQTIIEIGSFFGGSALWMADMAQSWGLQTHVYSIDISKVLLAQHERVTFLQGNARNLSEVLSEEFLEKLPRPWLVIEDADHTYQTTSSVLQFFHPELHDGEYIIIEDVMTSGAEAGRALREFLNAHPTDYLVDRHYCDFFGTNVTWCVNGYLKRLKPAVPVG